MLLVSVSFGIKPEFPRQKSAKDHYDTDIGKWGVTMKDEKLSLRKEESGASACTFEVTVKFQQNSTWQGQIFWAEKNIKQNFRSVLEMLRLMDEALGEGSEGSSQPVVWEK